MSSLSEKGSKKGGLPRGPMTEAQKLKLKKKRLRSQRFKADPLSMRSQIKRVWKNKFANYEQVSGKRRATRVITKRGLSLASDWSRRVTLAVINTAYTICNQYEKGGVNHNTFRSSLLEIFPVELYDEIQPYAEKKMNEYLEAHPSSTKAESE